MKTTVTKWGNSLAVRIPRPVARELGFGEGTPIQFEIQKNAIVLRKPKHSLSEMLTQISPQNIHNETGTGKIVGNETW